MGKTLPDLLSQDNLLSKTSYQSSWFQDMKLPRTNEHDEPKYDIMIPTKEIRNSAVQDKQLEVIARQSWDQDYNSP